MSQVIHALLIEDNRIEARQTQYWLATNKEIAIDVEWVEQLSAALERLADGGIDVVLLDLNLTDSRGLKTFATIHQRVPAVPIIVLTGEFDESLGITAVEQGAEDYLVKQHVDGGTLPKIVAYTVARHRAKINEIEIARLGKSARILSFVGAKGGVGTTTVAVNVAVALAESGQSVILAELQSTFGDLAFSLQSDPTTSLADLWDLPAERIDEHVVSGHLFQGPAAIRILFGSHSKKKGGALNVEVEGRLIVDRLEPADVVLVVGNSRVLARRKGAVDRWLALGSNRSPEARAAFQQAGCGEAETQMNLALALEGQLDDDGSSSPFDTWRKLT